MKAKIEDVFFRRSVDVLFALEDRKGFSEIFRSTRFGYGFVHKTLKDFEMLGIVKRKREGRKMVYELTPAGVELFHAFKKIKEV